MALTGFDGFLLKLLPRDGIWRVTDWDDPLDPPPPPPPLAETAPDNDESRRWDDPEGRFRTLYCATEAEGAFGEKLSSFRLMPGVVREIEDFLEESPDQEFANDDLGGGLSRADIEDLNWKVAWAPTVEGAEAIDVAATRTQLAMLPGIRTLLRSFGIPRFDREALRSSKRGFTRGVAGFARNEATDEDGELRACGLRYESRLIERWECWALWDPLPISDTEAEIENVSIDYQPLRSAAAKLGVPLLD